MTQVFLEQTAIQTRADSPATIFLVNGSGLGLVLMILVVAMTIYMLATERRRGQ
jgi:hypothetical protein